MVLELERTRDIIRTVASKRRAGQMAVGFAAETENLIENATEELERKRLDLVVANDPKQAMGADSNQVSLVMADGKVENWPRLGKNEVANRIIDRVAEWLSGRSLDQLGPG